MRDMFKAIRNHMDAGDPLVLVTVIASSGSVPRDTGARMLVGPAGRICGTIGGGAVEYRSEKIARNMLDSKESGEYDFTLTKDDVQNLGMICGGAVNVYFSYISPDNAMVRKIADEAERQFAQCRDIWLISDISSNGRLGIFTRQDGIFGMDEPSELRTVLAKHPVRFESDGHDYYLEEVGFSGHVYVFGGGHCSQELVPVLEHLGFRCIVLDDRPEFANRELFPAAEEVKHVDFSHVLDSVTIGEDDYVIVMTRGHAYDMLAQAAAMKTPACYIGVIGSSRKIARVSQQLKEQGFTDRDLARVTSPIGLDIQADTPAEIAISIATQLIDVRATRNRGAIQGLQGIDDRG